MLKVTNLGFINTHSHKGRNLPIIVQAGPVIVFPDSWTMAKKRSPISRHAT